MGSPEDPQWLASFHRGERPVMTGLYEDYYDVIDRAVGKFASGVDRENLVHDVFCALLADDQLRRNFQGGSLRAWLATIARNRSIDYVRRQQRKPAIERRADDDKTESPSPDRSAELNIVVDRCRNGVLPAKWVPLFELRFVEQLSQRECAERLGVSRTTLLYQETRIRALLRRFLLKATP